MFLTNKMEFLKELIQIQQAVILDKLADNLLSNDLDKIDYIIKYNKPNYQLIKVSNTKMMVGRALKISALKLSALKISALKNIK